VSALLAVAPAASAAPTPLGRACAPDAGVRFCPGTPATRVPSFDGVPLDVDVTLPPTGDGPFPTLVMLHGWGGNKGSFETDDPTGGEDRYSNVWFAKKGYAVVNYSARGFGGSCGTVTSRNHPGCVQGWLHLGDQRYEGRDTQYLLGLLADQGIARPDALGVTGISYGGGQSMILAYLNDRVRQPDGTLVPWRSPKGTPLKIAASWPRWPWSDLVSALTPNGRFRDFERPRRDETRKPIGIPKQSFISGLFATGSSTGFYSPPGVDPKADLTTWFAQISRGEPESQDQRDLADEIHNFHGAFGVPPSAAGTPPLLIQEGWTDDLFPAPEALRAYNDVRVRGGNVALQLADIGHQRGQNKQPVDVVLNSQGSDFLDRHLRRTGSGAPASGSVLAYTQTCPATAPAGGPFRASNWAAITPGAVRRTFAAAQTVQSDGGDPQVGTGTDPVAGGGDPCRSFASEDAPGTAVYKLPVTSAFTLLGLPVIQARIDTTGAGGQLDARLWDVGPDGEQILVSRGGYRLADNQSGRVLFQINGNGYRFARGHTARLELTGRDAPYLRPSNGPFSIEVSDLTLELPVRERPGAGGGTVVRPVLGEPSATGRGSRGRRRLKVSVKPRRVRAGQRKRFRIVVRGRSCARCKLRRVRGSRVRFAGKTYRLRGSKKTVKRRFRRRGLVRVRAMKRGYRSSSLPVRVLRRRIDLAG
jgi:hypothetical protein